jgi:hypothetical protein
LTGHPDVASLEAAQMALAADPTWLAYLDDEVGDAFVEDPALTRSTVYRKVI